LVSDTIPTPAIPVISTAPKTAKLVLTGLVCGFDLVGVGVGLAVGVGLGFGVALGFGVGLGIGVGVAVTAGNHTACNVAFCVIVSGATVLTPFSVHPANTNPVRVGVGNACSTEPAWPEKL